MKKMFGLLLLSVGTIFIIQACETPEERANKANTTDSIEHRADSLPNNPPDNTDVDMDSSESTAIMPDSAVSQHAGDSVEMQKKKPGN